MLVIVSNGCQIATKQYPFSAVEGVAPIPAGTFTMGTVDFMYAMPVHPVTFASAFEIDKYEVTVAAYKAYALAAPTGYTAPKDATVWSYCNWNVAGKEQHPVNCINWNQANAYCVWAGKRLCSESEWEYAARGLDGRKYPWGNDDPNCADRNYAVKDGCNCAGTCVVGAKSLGASPYGAMDMAGNVWEWVKDWFHEDYTGAPADGSAWEIPAGTQRIKRGGSFYYDYYSMWSWRRENGDPAYYGDYDIGTRCCRSP